MSEPIGVLFVCLGNICRSPLAEAVFRMKVEEAGLADRFRIDSAGTSDYHIGSAPNERTVAVAAGRGLRVEHAARQVSRADFDAFDYVLAMDARNLGKLERIAREGHEGRGRAQLHLFRRFDDLAGDDLEVPDPYFGGADGFEEVHDMVERAAEGLLAHIRGERGV